MSRPTKLNAQTIKILCESAKLGAKRSDCAERAGISTGTLYSWLSKGKRGDPDFIDFYQQMQKAKAEGVSYNLALIQKEAQTGNWHCAAWLLERCHGYNRTATDDSEELIEDFQAVNVKELLEQIEKSNDELKGFLSPKL